MAVRVRRVFGPLLLTVAGGNIYTVPTGRTLIIRSIWWANSTGGAAAVKYGIGGLAAAQLLQPNQQAPANSASVLQNVTGAVLNPGDQLWMSASVANTVYATCFGSLLLGAPV